MTNSYVWVLLSDNSWVMRGCHCWMSIWWMSVCMMTDHIGRHDSFKCGTVNVGGLMSHVWLSLSWVMCDSHRMSHGTVILRWVYDEWVCDDWPYNETWLMNHVWLSLFDDSWVMCDCHCRMSHVTVIVGRVHDEWEYDDWSYRETWLMNHVWLSLSDDSWVMCDCHCRMSHVIVIVGRVHAEWVYDDWSYRETWLIHMWIFHCWMSHGSCVTAIVG